MKIKTNELAGRALDAMVAIVNAKSLGTIIWHSGTPWVHDDEGNVLPYMPTESWSQGGPIIERERIAIAPSWGCWVARIRRDNPLDEWLQLSADTPLIAAMRCYVASRLGDEVDVPKKLCKS